jgi:hypothetical protein
MKLMLINYLTKFYKSKLYVKVICTSYDIPKAESCVGKFCFKKEIRKEKERVARGLSCLLSVSLLPPVFFVVPSKWTASADAGGVRVS